MFQRIVIVNRGEPAVRLIHAVRELNEEQGAGLRTIALHTPAEASAMFVRNADEAVTITPRNDGPANPYLDLDVLGQALRQARAEAVWVGWGFVAERPEFADLCADLGVTFIGPPADVMRKLGDKIGAKLLAEGAGVPVAPWSGGSVDTVEDALGAARRIGYPLVVKATAGGGGRGIRVVTVESELGNAFESARGEALRSFGDATVFLERLVEDAHHVEVQVVADHYGSVWALGVRDCSAQRRRQKVIEESSSTALSAEASAELKAAAVRMCQAAGYRNAGTVEFLYQAADAATTFLEVNTRLQVEHPVTELTTGVDIVKLQLAVAAGHRLEGSPPPEVGHAMEARLNAEDPQRGFAPAPGAIEHLVLPTGPCVRVDTGVSAGDVIPPQYDSMIAKIIAWGRDRDEARARLSRAVAETVVVVRGGTTNKSFLLELLERPELVRGEVTTGWLDRVAPGGELAPPRYADVALLTAAVHVVDEHEALEQASFFAAAARGRPAVRHDDGSKVEFRYRGQPYAMTVAKWGRGHYRVESGGRRAAVRLDRLRPFDSRITVGGTMHRVVVASHGIDHLIEVDGAAHRVAHDEGGIVRAPAPGLVVTVLVHLDDVVEAGATVVVLESMKTETPITAPVSGRVREIAVAPNAQVDAGAPLLTLEAIATDDATPAGELVDLMAHAGGESSGDPRDRVLDHLRWLRWQLLGYDVTRAASREILADYRRARPEIDPADAEVLAAEVELLGVFADLSELSRNRRVGDDPDLEDTQSSREHFFRYARSLDADTEGLPASFVERLRRALTRYGVDDLDRTPLLRESVFRIFLAHQDAADHVAVVVAVLEAVQRAASVDEVRTESLREQLDRLVVATQLRFPVVGELARSVRFQAFDAPQLDRRREATYAEVRRSLDELETGVDDARRAEIVHALVTCPHPLHGLLVERIGAKDGGPDPLLEIIVRRYYVIRRLEHVRHEPLDGRDIVTAEYSRGERRFHVLAMTATEDDLREAVEAIAARARALASDHFAVIDLYVRAGEVPAAADASAEAGALLTAAQLPEGVRRVVVSIGAPGDPAALHLSYRRHDGVLREEPLSRGMHPMISRRLQLWRLSNFDLDRLPAPPEYTLFHAVAKENPSDERLIAVAEVRDMTPARDANGRVIALPELERTLALCVDGLRTAQEQRPLDQRLEWNRVVLYAWSAVDAPIEELQTVIRNLAPLTEGVGLEQVMTQVRLPDATGELREVVVRVSNQPGAGLSLRITDPPRTPLRPHDEYTRKVLQARRRGTVYPFEVVRQLIQEPGEKPGEFVEHDLVEDGKLEPVDRAPGYNQAAIVVGLARTPTAKHPDGMTRVVLMGDPTKALGSLAEPECTRIIAAIDLADELGVPVEWFAVSSGAKISMDSGTENMDWIARVLRRIITFTQAGGEINVVVAGINVGAQPYWNAEATMLLHTKGILVMTPDSAMVLTGKQALDYSGGVSAEDNFGIGGYDRIMGPNGQSQYWAPDLAGACRILFAHYDHTYVAPGERFPRRAATSDPVDRDVRGFPHQADGGLDTVGDIFSDVTNPGRKKPFDIRTVLRAVSDQDHEVLERWGDQADADTGIVQDAHLGGMPVTLIGIESRPLPRWGFLPADGPDQWTAGTLFPVSSKKVARAINAASGNRPVVVVANLTGFDGSPESLRRLQLEYGAEIGRAVVNFDGPFVFCVISRYHGGAFVVFSNALNDDMEVLAVEGSHASVIGGAPAAAVVFAGDVNRRTRADDRVRALEAAIAEAPEQDRARLRADLAELTAAVRSEMVGVVAAEFDAVHTIQRAQQVGSVHEIIPAARLRPALIEAVERGIQRVLARQT